jgi:formate dehydrogenase beta subunit
MLDKVNLWSKYSIGSPASSELKDKAVVRVGGGFTSMDVVRCSVREGAKKVIMLYRRDEKTIIRNTTIEEYTEAVEEGVEFIFYSAINKIITDEDDNLKSLLVDKYELVPDPNGGRAKLQKIEGASFEIECDYLIPAVSQALDTQLLPQELDIQMTSWNSIKTNGRDFMTSRKGIFAAGDCEYGPMTIVNAVGQARRAASVISRYIYTGEISLTDEEIMEDHMNRLKVYNKNEKITNWMPGLPREISEKLSPENVHNPFVKCLILI